MKKLLNLLGGFLLVFCLMLTSPVLLSSCKNSDSLFGNKDGVTQEYVDSAITIAAQNLINPLFSNVDDVLEFRGKSLEGQAIDDVFNSMPEKVLINVASVCIKRDGNVSKRGIVYEYQTNKSIYENLPEPSKSINDANSNNASIQGSKDTLPNAVKRRLEDVITYNQRDTVIGGQTYKMHVKTETSYE